MNPGITVFDLDGTLVDVGPFLHLVQGPKKDYDGFHRATNADGLPVAWALNLMRTAAAQGTVPIILTGRAFAHLEQTRDWVARHVVPAVGFTPTVITRNAGDTRRDDQVKRDIVDRLSALGHRVVGAVDDRPQVLALWRELGIDPLVCLRPDWEAAGEPYTDADRAAWARQEPLRRAHGWLPAE